MSTHPHPHSAVRNPQSTPWRLALLLCLAVGLPAVADTVVLTGGLKYDNVRITGVRGGELYWLTSSGNETHRPLDKIERIALADEPALTAAENAYVARQWATAAESYEKVIRTTQKAWLKDWAGVRLSESASKVEGRFDLFISGYIPALLKDPESAKKIEIAFPKPDSKLLTEAITKVKAANTGKLTPAQQQDLLELEYQLQQARNDKKAADDVLARILTVNPNHPIAQQAEMRRIIEGLKNSLKAREWDKVIAAIDSQKDKFNAPAQQAEVLFCLAEARAGKAADAGSPEAWKDAALDYMRIVSAGFPASTPQVPQALMKTADILEKQIKDSAGALRIYKQVAQDYRGQPAATEAEAAVKRLEGAQ